MLELWQLLQSPFVIVLTIETVFGHLLTVTVAGNETLDDE